VLTAVLFYFGWARAKATYEYFGVDLSLLDFSTSDYLLRSVNSAFRPLLLIGLIALAATGLHQWLVAAVETHGVGSRRLRRVPIIALSVGASLAAIALLGLAVVGLGQHLGVLLPASLAAGFALLAYAEFGWARFRRACTQRSLELASQIRSFLLVGLASMALFWTVSLYAGEIGRQRARVITSGLASSTQIAIYARDRLLLAGPGIELTEIRLADSKYRYRYTGLRLLVRSQDRYVLLPRGWAHGRAGAYILRDGDDIRLEFTAR
jgi:hypothetical protein